MVSFQCESCGDVLTKKKLDPHRNRCRGATFSCIDCMVHFVGTDYRSHTSCMTEDQKYQGALYKKNSQNGQNGQNGPNKNTNKKARISPPNSAEDDKAVLFHTPTPASASAAPPNRSNMAAVAQGFNHHHHMSHAAYVEDVPEELENYLIADDDDGNSSRSDDDNAPPHAPTPPPAAEGPVNVFDFLVVGGTPNASNLELPQVAAAAAAANAKGSPGSQDVVPYAYDAHDYLDAAAAAAGAGATKQLVEYSAGAVVEASAFQTPAPGARAERRKKESAAAATAAAAAAAAEDSKDAKKDKKRKRLYLDIHDQVMTDAPPVLHSGLTGGLHRLTTKHPAAFPPSPESAETPASPLKKSKNSKHGKSSRSEPIATSLFSMLAGSSKPKTTKKRKHRSESPSGKKHSSSHRHHRHHRSHRHEGADADKAAGKEGDASAQKLLEFPSDKKDAAAGADGQMIVYRPRADLFLSFVNKGPESERGYSMNKALKRFHRERTSSGTALGRTVEEKELFRSLRLRKNDRGEIVLFCVDD